MAEPTTARPGIDPIMAALLEAFPFKFTADDGVEVAREQMRQLKAPPEALPDMRIEERTIDYGDITGIPVRIYWPPIAQHDNLPVVNISTLGVPGFPYTWDLMRGFRYLDVDPEIRRWVLELNIAWVYVDSRAPIIGAEGAPANWTGGGMMTTVPGLERLDDTPGVILAHVDGSVRIYQVDLDAVRRMDAADRGP